MKILKARMKGIRIVILFMSLLITTGSFAQWTEIYQPYHDWGSIKHRLQFTNANTGFAMFDYTIKKTVDAGSTWTTSDSTNESGYGYHDMFFYNSTYGYATLPDPTNANALRFKRTIDGGLTWSPPISLPMLVYDQTTFDNSIYFVSADTGFIFDTYGNIIRTVNGGASWNPSYGCTCKITSMCFTSATTGYATGYDYVTGSGFVIKTTNKGVTWSSSMPLPGLSSFPAEIKFTSPDTGFVMGVNQIFKTVDAGATWSLKYTVSNMFLGLVDLSFPTADTGYALASNGNTYLGLPGNIFRTVNGGETWLAYGACNPEADGFQYLNTTTGYLIAGARYGYPTVFSKIEKTTNGGFSCPDVHAYNTTNNVVPAGTSVGLTALPTLDNPYVYSWSPAVNMTTPNMQSTGFSMSTPGVLTPIFVTLTDTIYGCPPITTQTSVYTWPTFSGTVSLGNDTVICGGDYNSFELHPTTNWNDSVCYFSFFLNGVPIGSYAGQYTIINDISNAEYVVYASFPDGSEAWDTINISAHTSFNDSVFYCSAPVTIGLPEIANSDFLWNTGDTTHTILASSPGIYSLIATYTSPACTTSSVFTVIDSCAATSNVWPGDTNLDLIANNIDVLNIGLAFGETELPRPMASTNWWPQPMTNWSQDFITGVNHKHADTNGDGVVTIADDTTILYNYNYSHPPLLAPHASSDRSTADLYLVAQYDTVGMLATVEFAVMLGQLSVPIDSIYGIAYSLSYDAELTYQPMTVNYDPSWFGNPTTNLFSFEKAFHSDGYIDLAVSKDDHANSAGSGQIGKGIIVTTDNLSGIYSVLHVDIYDVVAVTASGSFLNLSVAGDSVAIYVPNIGMKEIDLQSTIKAYPNPSTGNVSISSKVYPIEVIKISNVFGQEIYSTQVQSLNTSLDMSAFENGVYMISVTTEKGTINKRITLHK